MREIERIRIIRNNWVASIVGLGESLVTIAYLGLWSPSWRMAALLHLARRDCRKDAA